MNEEDLIHLRETNRQSHPIRHEAIKELHRRQKFRDRRNLIIQIIIAILTVLIFILTFLLFRHTVIKSKIPPLTPTEINEKTNKNNDTIKNNIKEPDIITKESDK